jgi:hypothetical protein
MITFDVPNIDDASIDPADYDALTYTLSLLKQCTMYKAQAMRYRLCGFIEGAIRIEAHLERAYKQLPTWAKW